MNKRYINRRFFTAVNILFASLANIWILMSYNLPNKNFGLNKKIKREKKVVVSLTTFPARIETVWISIESLLRQTYQPDLIILWLATEQFNDVECLPEKLKDLQKKGLTIKFCDDLKSHKKYYFSFKEYPDDIIITVDDDIIYPENTISVLMESYEKNPDCIICNRGHLIKIQDDGKIAPYDEWVQNPSKDYGPSKLLCPTGVSGVLYPPNAVNKEVFNQESIKNLCIHADDLWLKIMSLKNNTRVIKTPYFSSELFVVRMSQKVSLAQINVNENKNNEQLEAILSKYSISFEE